MSFSKKKIWTDTQKREILLHIIVNLFLDVSLYLLYSKKGQG